MIIQENLSHFLCDQSESILDFNQGLEKEGLRVLGDAKISHFPHSMHLGHKLTHPYITTDYSENLLEFISPVFNSSKDLLAFMQQIHGHTLVNLDKNEYIWPFSMPALLPENDMDIPLAYYGESHIGKLKTLYRKGLGYRYGRAMQSIAGLHYNFSFSEEFLSDIKNKIKDNRDFQDFKNEVYFKLIRNFKRYSSILPFLFGSSPVVDKSFLVNREHNLSKIFKDTYGLEYATCLRMGGLGYTSEAQKDISVCYNQLKTYIKAIESARLTSYPPYEKIGLKYNEKFKQLNTNLLQIDNEFYSTLRPKNVAKSQESALQALHRRGVEYIEVRLMDLDPYSRVGVSESTLTFLQAFLIFCFYKESKIITKQECECLDQNFYKIVTNGRDEKCTIQDQSKSVLAKDYFLKILHDMESFFNNSMKLKALFSPVIRLQIEKVQNYSLLPSNQVVKTLSSTQSFIDYALNLAKNYKHSYNIEDIDNTFIRQLNTLRDTSIRQEQVLLNESSGSFEVFLKNYFEEIRIL